MLLIQRLEIMLKYYKCSQADLATKVGESQQTINRYFNKKQEDKLSQLLWKIHEIFPEISRDWLFFGEGEMLDKARVDLKEVERLKNRILELEEKQKLSDKIINKILDNDDIEKTA